MLQITDSVAQIKELATMDLKHESVRELLSGFIYQGLLVEYNIKEPVLDIIKWIEEASEVIHTTDLKDEGARSFLSGFIYAKAAVARVSTDRIKFWLDNFVEQDETSLSAVIRLWVQYSSYGRAQ